MVRRLPHRLFGGNNDGWYPPREHGEATGTHALVPHVEHDGPCVGG